MFGAEDGFRAVPFRGPTAKARVAARTMPPLESTSAPHPPGSAPAAPKGRRTSLRSMLAQQSGELGPAVPPRRNRGAPAAQFAVSLAAREAGEADAESAPLWQLVRGVPKRTLPVELWVAVLEYLDFRGIVRTSVVCRRIHRASNTEMLWRRVRLAMNVIGLEPSSDAGRSAKQDVIDFVLATRTRVRDDLDHMAQRHRGAAARLEERIAAVPAHTISHQSELQEELPRLRETVQAAETALARQAKSADDSAAASSHAQRVLQDAKRTLAATQSQLRAATSVVERHATAVAVRAKLDALERRVVAAVLTPVVQLPVPLRRGTDSFGGLELLALQLSNSTLQERWGRAKKALGIDTGDYFTARDAILKRCAATPAFDGGDVLTRNAQSGTKSQVALRRFVEGLLDANDAELVSQLRL